MRRRCWAVMLLLVSSSALAVRAKLPPGPPIKVSFVGMNLPLVEIEIANAGWLPEASDIKLRAGEHGPSVAAQQVRSYAEAGKPIAIAFVMQGGVAFTGDDEIESTIGNPVPDGIGAFERAFDSIEISKRVPAGSEVSVITYGNGANVRVPWRPVQQLHGADFGSQRDYDKVAGADLITGIQVALGELDRSHASRKLMIIVGDGADSHPDTVRPALKVVKQDLANHGVEVSALIARSWIDNHSELDVLVGDVLSAMPQQYLGVLEQIVRRATDHMFVTFDISTLPVFDGRETAFYVEVPGKYIDDPILLTLGYAPPPAKSSAWLQISAAISLFAMLAAFMRSIARE